jgi:uncharacterized membrane protein
MPEFYSEQLGNLARRQGTALSPRWTAAVLVYFLIPGGIVLFVRPMLHRRSRVWQAFAWGAAFGLVVYGVYDLTNYSILADWTLAMTIADILWGCTSCGITSVAALVALKRQSL